MIGGGKEDKESEVVTGYWGLVERKWDIHSLLNGLKLTKEWIRINSIITSATDYN